MSRWKSIAQISEDVNLRAKITALSLVEQSLKSIDDNKQFNLQLLSA
jgi:hypothetical protein